ncbi:hypothetical protein TIFTF001_014244 [Ficus carica]|uniref:Uncharacterized protein n=1 Tax=Ficus carica TaxID=3494 RepID=A0AA88AJ91_FICCA|nr:hypothetical protein TIFTF001_014244 [Ficus carica]
MFGWFERSDEVSRSSTLGLTSTRGWHQNDAGIDLPDSIPVRLIIPHTITPCVVGGPTGEGRSVRARPCGGFTCQLFGHPSSKLPIRQCDTSYVSLSLISMVRGYCFVIEGFWPRGWRLFTP